MKHEPVQYLFDRMAQSAPDQVAISCGDMRITYRELQQRTDKLAHLSLSGGAKKGSIVAVLLDSKVDAITSIIAVLKAGAVFVPFDPLLPNLRLETMVREVTPYLFISESNLMGRLNGFVHGKVLTLDKYRRLDQLALDNVLASKAGEPSAPDDFCYIYFTSGSAGRPKSIAGRLKGIDHFIRWQIETLGIGKDDRVSQLLPLSFDGSLRDIFVPLCAGGTICIPEHNEIVTHTTELVSWLDRESISLIHCVPTLFRAILNEELHADQFRTLRYVLLAGEALLPSDVGRWRAVFGDRVKLINLYGTSETTMAKFIYEVQPGDEKRRSVPVGKPMPGARALIVDEEGRACWPGTIGEIYISTPYRSHGYYKQPELTAEVFIQNPFSTDPDDVVYKTGDLGRMLDDGNLELLGRKDQQVKIRGVRVELEELNSVVRGFPSVKDVAVVDRKDTSGVNFLCAYIVGDGQLELDSLRAYLHERLPSSMVPSAFVLMEKLPRTMSGKIDRRALPHLKDRTGRGEYVPPRTATEQIVADIWTNILGLPKVSVNDNFFELGGHSLIATQVMVRVRKTMGVELPLRALFESPTVAQLAAQIEAALQAGTVSAAPPLVPVARDGELPLSFAQQRLWFLHQLEPASAVYNCPAAVRFSGALNLAALAQSFNEVVRRHEVLRTRFSARDGRPVQVIAAALEVPLSIVDLSGLPPERVEAELEQLSRLEAQRAFDLSADVLLRTKVLRVSGDEHVVVVTMHHIVSDGWSIGVLVKEVAALYEAYTQGHAVALKPLAVQYADYAHWEREWLQGEVLDEQLAYWREQLAAAPVLELPSDRPRPPAPSYRGEYESFKLDQELTAGLKELSRRLDATLFMTLMAAWQALLYRYSGQRDIVVGTPIANRQQAETEELIGFFVNLLALRTDVSGNPRFAELVQRVRETALGAYAHQTLPFEKLIEELQPERDASHSPLVQVVFVLQNAPQGDLTTLDLKLNYGELETSTAKFDLVVNVDEVDDQLSVAFTYSTDLFEAASMERLERHFRALLAAVVENADKRISELDFLSPEERRRLIVERNATETSYTKDKCVHQLFEEQAKRSPDAIALVADGQQITYAELQRRAALLAGHLRQRGLGPGNCVGIFLEHSIETVVAILGVLRTGAAYVPLDTEHPRTRLAFIIADAQLQTVLTQETSVEKLPLSDGVEAILVDKDDWQETPIATEFESATPADVAYVIYTSGSTGQPKGVQISHRALVNYLCWCKDVYIRDEAISFALYSSLAFDLTVTSLFTPLVTGNRLIIYGRSAQFAVQRIVQDNLVDVLKLTPSHLALIKDLDNRNSRVKRLIVGGESLSTELALQMYESFGGQVEILNEYGPTEATVGCMLYRFDPVHDQRQSVPIGGAAANVQIYVLDEHLNPTPENVVGELFISGAGLAAGYLKRPELTAERFIPHPFMAGQRMYRSGDRARWLASGAIEYLGRVDEQVKYHGYRIELSEISSALNQHPQVRNSVVMLRQIQRGENTLVAYYVARREIESAVLREFLLDHLIKETIPNVFIHLTRLPLTLNGKIDYRALPELQESKQRKGEYTAPRTVSEAMVADIWATLLGLERVSLHDNFFELGGHSLIATQVMVRVLKAMSVELPLRALFENPTVAKFATYIDSSGPESTVSLPPIVPVSRDRELPLSFSQQRLWFLEQLKPGDPVYHSFQVLLITGPLDVRALELSFNEIIRRHEVLHTVFDTVADRPVQRVDPFTPMSLRTLDLSNVPQEERSPALEQLAADESQRPFDLSRGPLVRALLVVLGEQEHALLLTLHHIVSDGWSMGILCSEMKALYEAFASGVPVSLPALPIQYADFAVWQREHLQGDVLDKQLSYWRKQLANVSPVLELPSDRRRPEIATFGGARVTFELKKELTQQLKTLSHREGVTLFMVLLAALDALLYRYSGQTDIAVGTAIANRNRNETEGLIGFFVNMLVMRTDLSGNPTFLDLLQRVKQMTLAAYQHQDVPFEQIIEMLQPQRSMNRTPLYQVEFTLQNTPLEALEARGLRFTPLDVQTVWSETDLNLMMSESENGLAGEFIYATDLFDATTIERMLAHFQNLLEEITKAPEQRILELPLTSGSETRELLARWNVTDMNANKLVHQLFEEQAARTPEAVAVAFNDHPFTYAELNQRANQLARYLKRHNAQAETLVAVHLEQSFDLVVALLAILKAGAAFVPLDPSYPAETLAFMLADAKASILLTQRALPAELPESGARVIGLDVLAAEIADESVYDLSVRASGDNLAYAIYTSGSTGQSNGVLITHDSLTKYSLAFSERIGLRASDRILQFASPSFDVALEEIFPTLLCGATIVFGSEEDSFVPMDLLRVIERQNITGLELPTAYWHEWVRVLSARATRMPETLRFVIIGGEKVSSKLLAAWQSFGVPLIHVYGLTEATITSTVYELRRSDQTVDDLPLGQALTHTQIYLLDPYLRPVPPGITGEIYVAGECLARAYLNRPALTAERFIPNPFSTTPGARMYKTGDLARSLANGDLLFMGRVDHQLKIRGYRIEPNGIETLLKEHPLVQDAVVTLTTKGNGHSRLFKRGVAGAVLFADQNVIADKLATLSADEAEQLFAKLEALSEDESETILAMELQLDQERERTTIRRFPQFEVQLKLKDEEFINPPKEAQRNWLLRRALDEFASDLKHLDVVSRRFVAGSARPRLEIVPWRAHQATYDEHNLFIAGQQVMQDWELPLMDAMAKVVTEAHGDVLEVGFGMAISATCIQKYGVRSYTIMEANDEVVKRFHEWKKQFPGRDIRLVHGRWHDTHHQLADESFDGVFFDTVPTFEDEYLREVIDNVVMAEDFFPVAARVLRPGGIFTWYTNEIDTLSRRHQRLIQKYFRSFEVTVARPLYPPDDCHYWFADSMVVVKAVK